MKHPANWRMPAHYLGSTWEGYAWVLRGPDGEREPLGSVTQARLTFRRDRANGPLGLQLTLGAGLAITGDMIRAQRHVEGLPLSAGSYHFELSAFFADTCTWRPVCRGQVEILQNVPEGVPSEL